MAKQDQDTLFVIAAAYDTVDQAVADYEARAAHPPRSGRRPARAARRAAPWPVTSGACPAVTSRSWATPSMPGRPG